MFLVGWCVILSLMNSDRITRSEKHTDARAKAETRKMGVIRLNALT